MDTEAPPVQPVENTLISCPGTTPGTPLSKNQLKKQRKLAEQIEFRKLRRVKERERRKEKRADAKSKGLPLSVGPSRKELKRRQVSAIGQPNAADAISVAIDLNYDDLMQERDIAKCVKQCLRIYTINRRAALPLRLHFTGIKRDGHIHECLKKNDGWENWHVNYHFDCTHSEVFEKQQLVYLTCESDTVLDKPLPGHTYVIGGLVDHNHFKGLCHQRAISAGLATARLPLSEHVDMKTRSVLSTFHVFELLTRVAAGQDWTQAILETIPQRKGAKAKESNTTIAKEEQLEPCEQQLELVEEKQPSTES
ncbi:tRNA methyltransferase 10 homolog A [Drosophila grimshawi]|uniref:tRNA (guanine(9)-N(1))-methyltransferase n=1 Tax=Drosophila grimshawi TaxID=7222 RepID=B4J859_DROGR|nr:tRNA methyltransferase 10 homolog A [Drosophila grimshawi]EDW01196.1 GH20584 [Drosophila grimshawi]